MKIRMLFVLMGMLIFAVPQHARCEGGPAIDTVRRMLDDVVSIQTDPNLAAEQSRETRKNAIQKIIVREFDFPDMAREALGSQWEKLGGSERSEFRGIFQDLFLDSYSRLVLDFLKKEKIVYTAEEAQGDKTVVKTSIYRVNEQIPVDYYLAETGGKWLVRDVSIDGVSIVGNYRKSFARVIQKESFAGLMKRLRLQQKAIQKPS
jgi:phospholipid transport system substrate-binding protein